MWTRKSKITDRISLCVFSSCILDSAVAGADRSWAMIDPDIVMFVDRNPADVTNHPMMREWLRPSWIEDEAGCSACFRFVIR